MFYKEDFDEVKPASGPCPGGCEDSKSTGELKRKRKRGKEEVIESWSMKTKGAEVDGEAYS